MIKVNVQGKNTQEIEFDPSRTGRVFVTEEKFARPGKKTDPFPSLFAALESWKDLEPNKTPRQLIEDWRRLGRVHPSHAEEMHKRLNIEEELM